MTKGRVAILLAILGMATGAVVACTQDMSGPDDVSPPPEPAPFGFSKDVPRPINNEKVIESTTLNELMVKTFVALNWPADLNAGRGTARNVPYSEAFSNDDHSPRVWETWKQDWEIEGQVDRLSAWNDYAYDAASPPCAELHLMDGRVEQVTTKNWAALRQVHGQIIDKINLVKTDMATFAALTGPNIDSNGNPYQNATFFNKEVYDCWKDGTGEGCRKWPDNAGLCMPAADENNDGSVMVKASWRRLTEKEFHEGKYFARRLLVLEPGEGGLRICREQFMGLAGIHVVYKHAYIKAPSCGCDADGKNCGEPKDKWIWATFEQPDGVPNCYEGKGFTREPTPLECKPFPAEARIPSGECRITEIPPAFDGPNEMLAALPAPWKYYKMVNVDWLVGGKPDPLHRVANVRLETYSQLDSCMVCHNGAKSTDRIWALSSNSSKLNGNPCQEKTSPDVHPHAMR